MKEKFDLTPKEYKCACLISKGYTNEEICKELKIGLSTFKTHLLKIYQKLNLSYNNIDKCTMRVKVALLMQDYKTQTYKEALTGIETTCKIACGHCKAIAGIKEGVCKKNGHCIIYKILETINEAKNGETND